MGNQHGLLQYLLLSSVDEVNHTFFLWNYVGIPKPVISKLGKMGSYIPKPRMNFLTGIKIIDYPLLCVRLFFDYYFYYPIKYPFLLDDKLEFWGHDHVFGANNILRNHNFRLLEDGTLNYGPYPYRQPTQSLLWLKRLFGGKNYGEYLRYAGSEKRCKAIYLTGLSDEGEVLNDSKVKIKSFVEMWNESNEDKRRYINEVFGISFDLINECKKHKRILLTQPFSEQEIISEEEKIDMYRIVLQKLGNEVVIKPHPMETTDYSIYFPNNVILKTTAPMQLLSLNGIKFDIAYSVNSTALFDFPYKIKVCVLGSEIYPALYKKRPQWTSDTVKITNKNVEIIKLK